MKRISVIFQNGSEYEDVDLVAIGRNERECPVCGLKTLLGMPGGRDAICDNCGYKDPCCYD